MSRFGVINPDGLTPTKKKRKAAKSTMSPDLQRIIDSGGMVTTLPFVVGGNFGSRQETTLPSVWKPGQKPGPTRYIPLGQTGREAMLRNYIRSVGGNGQQSRPGDDIRSKLQEAAGRIQGFANRAVQAGVSGTLDSIGRGGGAGYTPDAGGMDYNSILQDIINGGIGAGIEAPDPAAMAAEQFAPQYDLLNQLRSQTTGRMNQQAADSQAMYDALAQSIAGDKTTVGKEYDTTAQNLDAAFGGAASAIQQTGDASNANVNAMLNRLGIGAAAPDAMAAIAEDQNRSANSVAELQANYAGANTANRQSMMDYLTNESNTAGIAGANARADVEQNLAALLAGYDNQQLSLKGQEMAAKNQYQMGINEMQQSSSLAQQQMAMDALDRMMQADQWEREFAFDQDEAGWDRQTDVWNNEIQRAAAERALRELEMGNSLGQDRKPDASTVLMQEASKYFSDPQMANAVSQRIREALASGDITTVGQLLSALQYRHPNNPYATQYAHLGTVFGQALGLR